MSKFIIRANYAFRNIEEELEADCTEDAVKTFVNMYDIPIGAITEVYRLRKMTFSVVSFMADEIAEKMGINRDDITLEVDDNGNHFLRINCEMWKR